MTSGNSFCLHVKKLEGYFHAICLGEITLAGVLKGWNDLSGRCFSENVNRVVCQPHASRPAEFLDFYQFGVSFRDIQWPPGMRIAVVCGQDDVGRYQLAETMVLNFRGPESRIFTDLEEATNWLLSA